MVGLCPGDEGIARREEPPPKLMANPARISVERRSAVIAPPAFGSNRVRDRASPMSDTLEMTGITTPPPQLQCGNAFSNDSVPTLGCMPAPAKPYGTTERLASPPNQSVGDRTTSASAVQ